jgi:hypothetical protein
VACSPQAPAQNAPAEQAPQLGLKQVTLIIRSASGPHRFRVQVAATADQQEKGLMFRRSLPADEGMIFPFDPPQEISFWMKNTLLPLDMIFIRPDRRIGRIATAAALDLTPVPSGERISAVLEIRGGRAAELGIREGDVVEWQG